MTSHCTIHTKQRPSSAMLVHSLVCDTLCVLSVLHVHCQCSFAVFIMVDVLLSAEFVTKINDPLGFQKL